MISLQDITSLVTDALLSDNVTYDLTQRRYRDTKTGRFVGKQKTIEIQKDFYRKKRDDFIHLGESLKNGTITEKQLALELKQLHISRLVIARGGVAEITSSDLGKVANLLRNQYYRGKDQRTGRSYGLKYLMQDVKDQSVARLNARLKMYAQSSEIVDSIVRENIAKEQGLTLYKRELGQTHKHCSSCILYASLGWQKVLSGTLPYPKTNCECATNCVCSLIYDTPENVGLAYF